MNSSRSPRRYDVWLANLDPTIGAEIKKTRPVVIVSDELMNKHLGTIVVCPLTTQIHKKWRSRIHKSNVNANPLKLQSTRSEQFPN